MACMHFGLEYLEGTLSIHILRAPHMGTAKSADLLASSRHLTDLFSDVLDKVVTPGGSDDERHPLMSSAQSWPSPACLESY